MKITAYRQLAFPKPLWNFCRCSLPLPPFPHFSPTQAIPRLSRYELLLNSPTALRLDSSLVSLCALYNGRAISTYFEACSSPLRHPTKTDPG